MLNIEQLEARDLPSATLLGGILTVVESGPGVSTVSIDNAPGQIQVTEGDGSGFNNAVSLFDATTVTGVIVWGAGNGVNVIQQNTSLPCLLLGGNRADTIFGGSGLNFIDPGVGNDTVYALLGSNVINTAGDGPDRVFTNFPAIVFADARDSVVRFFGPGRTPGSGFIGLDTSLNDGVLYIAPSNNGSWVILDPGPQPGDVVASYDLGDGAGPQTQLFRGVGFISYFGGTGTDQYLNNTAISEAVYGSASNDVLIGGIGAFSIEKGSGGNDIVVGRARHNDLSGNGGTDFLVDLGNHQDDILRTDAADLVFALTNYLSISP